MVEKNYFLKLIALSLVVLKVPKNRVASLLREPYKISGGMSHIEATSLIRQHSNDIPEISTRIWSIAQRIYEENFAAGIHILGIHEERYPKYLRVIKDAPPLLYVKGDLDIFESLPGVAIVGSRKTSVAGEEIARRLARYCAQNNWTVVSGLALGIDVAAHKGTLEIESGKTIAVLASGLDKPTPVANSAVGYEILEKGGAWVSEHSIGVPPLKHHFVPRNRLQIGLSAGSIIVEAMQKSGSLSQARFCVGQNRPLFGVMPQTPDNPLGLMCEGIFEMIDDLGAIPIKSKDDYEKLLKILSDERQRIS